MNKLTILGSGTGLSNYYRPFDFRHPSGYLLQSNGVNPDSIGVNILLDCGEGMRFRLTKIKFDYYNLQHIFISHFHPDHFNLDSLIQAFFLRARKEKVKRTLMVHGPPKIEKVFRDIWAMKHDATFFKKELNPVIDLKFHEYKDREVLQLNSQVSISPFKTLHGTMDAYALRFTLSDKILTYSGDTAQCPAIIEAAQNADLFLCESAVDTGDENEAIFKLHVSHIKAGEIAQKAGVKHLILTHYNGKDSADVMKQEAARSGFTGRVNVAKDFEEYLL